MPGLDSVLAGDTGAIARLIRALDDELPGAAEALQALYPRGGQAFVVGVTGSPGVGKSTLTDVLVSAVRARGERVAVVAVDPSSPFTGGALLGDRVRMQRHATDPGVFIRSFATRGRLGRAVALDERRGGGARCGWLSVGVRGNRRGRVSQRSTSPTLPTRWWW